MKAFFAFLAGSVALHAGILLGLPDLGTPEGQGAQGPDVVTLAAARHAALIEAWDTAPDTTMQPRQPDAPEPTATPMSLQPETAIARPRSPRIDAPTSEALPQVSTTATPAPGLPHTSISQSPALMAPQIGTSLPPTTATSEAGRATNAPILYMPTPESAQPLPDTRPHHEGSTALATETSPRPPARPEGLRPDNTPARAPSTAAPARTAAGTGGGTTQGAAPAPTPQPATSPAQIRSAMATWGGQIQARIARARPNVRVAGQAVVQLSVSPSGQLVGLGLSQSSGNPSVDQAALDAVRRVGRFPRAPAALTEASYSFSVPLTFQ